LHKLVTALLVLELAGQEILKHVYTMQYQFSVFKNVDCSMSFRKR